MTTRDQLVSRMREEQEVRKWSDAGLAKRISEYYPMTAATVWKLKNADPPRGLSLDEAKAISKAFDYSSIDAMLESTAVASWVSEKLVRGAQLIRGQQEAQLDVYEQVAQLLRECESFTEDNEVNLLDATDMQSVLDYLLYSPKKIARDLEASTAALNEHVERYRRLLRKKCPDLPPGEYERAQSKKDR